MTLLSLTPVQIKHLRAAEEAIVAAKQWQQHVLAGVLAAANIAAGRITDITIEESGSVTVEVDDA